MNKKMLKEKLDNHPQVKKALKSIYYSIKNRRPRKNLGIQSLPPEIREGKHIIYFDITSHSVTTSKTGIQRVVSKALEYIEECVGNDYCVICISGLEGYHVIDKNTFAPRYDILLSPGDGDIYLSIDFNPVQPYEYWDTLRIWQERGCKIVACVYDLVYEKYPEYVSDKHVEMLLSRWLNFAARHYDGLICISKSVKTELDEWIVENHIDNKRLKTGHFLLGSDFISNADETEKRENVYLDQLDLKAGEHPLTFIAVSTIEPRKGYLDLIEAFEHLLERGREIRLLIVGRLGWNYQEIINKITSSKFYNRSIFLFSDCDDDLLQILYKSADCYVSASYYEGFGLGVIEASNKGLPVLLRDIPVYREVSENKGLYFKDVPELEKQVELAMEDPDLLFKQNSINNLSWKESIQMAWSAVQDTIGNNEQNISADYEGDEGRKTSRKKTEETKKSSGKVKEDAKGTGKVAIVIQRYGEEVSGGGEFYARALASHLKETHDVTVLTTTSLDLTFSKYYRAGEFEDKGVHVIRFDNAHARDFPRMENLSQDEINNINAGRPTRLGVDLQWTDEWGPYCPDLIKYIDRNKTEYDAFIIFTYIYYTSVRSIPVVKDKAIFIPTAHDEIWIRPTEFQYIFSWPRYIGFLTKGEEEFVRSLFSINKVEGDIIGCGVDLPADLDNESFRSKYNLHDDYIAYVGRVDASKGCDKLAQFFLKYKAKYGTDLKLVLMGEQSVAIPKSDDILLTGFVTEQEKFDCLSGALALVAPSEFESLCIAVLESFSCGVPILANGKCKILADHCQDGKSGFIYLDENEFCENLYKLATNPALRKTMSMEALKYIRENYTWEIVTKKINHMIYNIVKENKKGIKRDVKHSQMISEFLIRDVFMDSHFANEVIRGNKETTIIPVFDDPDAVTICLTSSDYFAPMCGVALSSLIENASDSRKYDILILTQGMSMRNKKRIGDLAKANVSIRFVEFEEGLFSSEIATHDSYSIYTYYRLMIPSICKRYKKVLYLDSDMIINHDVAEIYDTNVEGCYTAAVLDLTILTWQVMKERHPLYPYLASLNLTEPGTYMQGGVAVYNIPMINDAYPVDVLVKKANERQYQNCDQELLNMCFKGKIKFVSANWNVVVMHPAYIDLYEFWMPRKYYDSYIEARKNPYVIHYSFQQIPSYHSGMDMDNYFWDYARRTQFYEDLLVMLMSKELPAVQPEQAKIIHHMVNKTRSLVNNPKYSPLVGKLFPVNSRHRESLKKVARKFGYK